jgi:hypothetical protein
MSTTSSTSTGALSAADQVEILNLYARYAFALDFGDGEALAATFSPDGALDAPGLHVAGSDMAPFAEQALEAVKGRGRHLTSNVWMEATDTGARGGGYLIHVMVADDDNPETTLNTTGIYEDTLVKEDGRWVFAHRNFVAD